MFLCGSGTLGVTDGVEGGGIPWSGRGRLRGRRRTAAGPLGTTVGVTSVLALVKAAVLPIGAADCPILCNGVLCVLSSIVDDATTFDGLTDERVTDGSKEVENGGRAKGRAPRTMAGGVGGLASTTGPGMSAGVDVTGMDVVRVGLTVGDLDGGPAAATMSDRTIRPESVADVAGTMGDFDDPAAGVDASGMVLDDSGAGDAADGGKAAAGTESR